MKTRVHKNRRLNGIKRGKTRRRTNKRNGGDGCGCGAQGCPIAPFPMKSGGKCNDRICGKRIKCNGDRICGKCNKCNGDRICGKCIKCNCSKRCRKCNGRRGCKHVRCSKCGMRSKCRTRRKKGGSHFFQQGAPVPPPFVGEPWTANTNTWPGYGESNNHGNHLPQNMYYQDPKMMMKLGGKKRTRRKRKGGASFLQNAANSYRDLEYNFKSAYNAASGYEPPVNPLPYKDQLQPRQN